MDYDTVVGLEVHIQLNTKTKAFCGDALSFGDAPNTHTSAISLAHPGTLPVVNAFQIEKGVKLGLALGCKINEFNFFDRKHYFYPDLPKGYQITQDNEPICIGGSLEIVVNGKKKNVKIHHIHMEEDAGKTIHELDDHFSMVDLNRAGTPLLELVTEPDLCSGHEVYAFIAELQKLLRYIDVSDADMEKGSMRCDCNVSVKPKGRKALGERCEIKNLNSKRFAREAVEYEAKRQINLLEKGNTFNMQTLHFNVEEKKTQVLREKEGVDDYRYLPDPDLAPIFLSEEYIDQIKKSMHALPWEVKDNMISELKIVEDHANQLTQDPHLADYFFELLELTKDAKSLSAFMVNLIIPALIEQNIRIDEFKIPTSHIIEYLKLISNGEVTASVANSKLWPTMLKEPTQKPKGLSEKLGILINNDESFVDRMITEVLEDNPEQVAKYKGGKKNLMGFFVGAIMKKSKGSANPKIIQQKIAKALQ